MKTSKRLWAALGLALSAQPVSACTTCSDVGSYGSDVLSDISSANQEVTNTTTDVAEGFAATSNALTLTGQSIVSAIEASTSTVVIEHKRASEIRTNLLQALVDSLTDLEKSRHTAEVQQEVATTYGRENIPVSLCDAYARAESREEAEQTAARLVTEHRDKQIERRGEEFREQVVDPFTRSTLSLGQTEYTEADAPDAMERAAVVSGEASFPVSPDTVLVGTTGQTGGSLSTEGMQYMTAWLRSSEASSDLASGIASRTRPLDESGSAAETISVMGEIRQEVLDDLTPDRITEASNATPAALLRITARRQALNARLRLEQLNKQMASARSEVMQLGFLNEQAVAELKDFIDSDTRGGKIKRSSN